MNTLIWFWWFRRSIFWLLVAGGAYFLLGWFIPDHLSGTQLFAGVIPIIEGWALPAYGLGLGLAVIIAIPTAWRIWRFYRYREPMCLVCAGPIDEGYGRRGVNMQCRHCGRTLGV